MKAKNLSVFFDFDNTITKFDVLDDMLPKFSTNNRWIGLERRWRNGMIGSLACLRGQVSGMRITKAQLDKYISRIKIDPFFSPLVDLFRANDIEPVIVSDNFDYIIKNILLKNGIKAVEVRSNRLTLKRNQPIPSFPHLSDTCHDCGNCKSETLSSRAKKDTLVVYIGDGKSDICAAEKAHLVFAKDELSKHFKKNGLTCIHIKGLRDVYAYFKGRIS